MACNDTNDTTVDRTDDEWWQQMGELDDRTTRLEEILVQQKAALEQLTQLASKVAARVEGRDAS